MPVACSKSLIGIIVHTVPLMHMEQARPATTLWDRSLHQREPKESEGEWGQGKGECVDSSEQVRNVGAEEQQQQQPPGQRWQAWCHGVREGKDFLAAPFWGDRDERGRPEDKR